MSRDTATGAGGHTSVSGWRSGRAGSARRASPAGRPAHRVWGLGNSHLAEDIAQQVFVELFTAIRRFDPERPFAPWLYRIVVNISLKELRRRDHRNLPLEEAAADQPSLDPLPDLVAEESEVRGAIWAAVRSLNPKQRAAVVLRYYHGFSEAEMAFALGCRRGTVKSRLHSALRRLESLLRDGGTSASLLELRRDGSVPGDGGHGKEE